MFSFYWFYVAVKAVSTTYNLVWDFIVSWGLFDSTEPGKYGLRKTIHYKPIFYYYAMIMDALIRWWWLLTAF